MDSNLFNLSGYGQFVWPAFIFTFISCLSLYLITKKELKKQEKIFFSEYKQLQTKRIHAVEEKKDLQEVISPS